MLRDTTMAAALITLALALAGCKTSAQEDPRTQPELVRVTTVATPAGGSGSFTGAVTARVQSDLGFRVSGKVIRRMVDARANRRFGTAVDANRYYRLYARHYDTIRKCRGCKGPVRSGRGG